MRLADLVDALHDRYDPAWAADWDAVGLVLGHPDDEVRRVHLAIDPVPAVAAEAIARGADLLLTHHPLWLRGVTSMAATDAKGSVAHTLVRARVGLLVAHTNADVAPDGVSDALAALLGLADVRVLAPEGPARGLGRIGTLPAAMTLAEFTSYAGARLAATAGGVRGAGEPGRPVRTVAVCGGSGGELAATAAAAGADVLLTSDLKHHVAGEALADTGIALVDAAHWATERPWLDHVAAWLGTSVEVSVSSLCTDPWTVHAHRSTTEDM